jgi:hypothetical protein
MQINLEWIFEDVRHPRFVLIGLFLLGYIVGKML